jgi:hypothetical protein
MSNPSLGRDPRAESGQIAVLAAFVIGLMVAVAVGIALVGAAMVDRTAATVAADAVALADAVDPAAASSLAGWYQERGYDVRSGNGHAEAVGDAAQARSQATADRELRVAPVVRAVVARAEQLLGRQLSVLTAEGVSVTFSSASARQFDAVAAELGMCATDPDTFMRCSVTAG